MEIRGTKGSVVWDCLASSLQFKWFSEPAAEDSILSSCQRNVLFVDEVRHFIHCVDERKEPIVSVGDGIKVLEMAINARSLAGIV